MDQRQKEAWAAAFKTALKAAWQRCRAAGMSREYFLRLTEKYRSGIAAVRQLPDCDHCLTCGRLVHTSDLDQYWCPECV